MPKYRLVIYRVKDYTQRAYKRHMTAGGGERRQAKSVSEGTDLVFGERQQRGEPFSTDGAHVVFGGAAVRLGVLPQAALGEEGAGADVALVVPLDEVGLLLASAWQNQRSNVHRPALFAMD